MTEIGSSIAIEDAVRLERCGAFFRLPEKTEWKSRPGFPPSRSCFGARSPAVIAIYGMASLLPELIDSAKPGWRET
jgi:hypothetical protein